MIQSERDHSTLTNPFRPGMGLDPPYLADRTAQLARFDQYLAGFPSFQRNVRLAGLRGVGKTVLLQHYASAAEDWGWVVVRRECSEHLQDESTFALALVEDCRRAVEHSSRTGAPRRRSGTAARRVLDLLGNRECCSPTTRRTCSAIRHARRQFALGLFLASVARAQRSGLPVMFVACGLPTLTDNLARARSYSERMFQAKHLDTLRPPEGALGFTRPLEAGGRADADVTAVRRLPPTQRGGPLMSGIACGSHCDSCPAAARCGRIPNFCLQGRCEGCANPLQLMVERLCR